jgi:hypothetical protein
MTGRFRAFEAKGISLTIDLAVGHIRSLEIEFGGRRVMPLHSAPWIEDRVITEDPSIPACLQFLSGDFFCAPFGESDIEEAPPHGWPANGRWDSIGEERKASSTTVRFALERKVLGARVLKEITLRDGHPFVYQRHIFEGGSGGVSAASHAMTRFSGRGHLSFSPKAFGDLPAATQETDPVRGRSLFARSTRFTDLARLPLADGTTADLHAYPVADGHEDFVMLVEEKGAVFGWTAAARVDTRDIVLSLKNPLDFPVTFLWFSNGGRLYPPWNGRHLGVLGIEEGRAWSTYGHAASIAPNPLSEAGIPTSLTLTPSRSVSLSHIIGGIPLPAGWGHVTSVEASAGLLRVAGDDGNSVEHPYDGGFLDGR